MDRSPFKDGSPPDRDWYRPSSLGAESDEWDMERIRAAINSARAAGHQSGLRAALEAVRENWRAGQPVTPMQVIERLVNEEKGDRNGR